MKNTLRFIFIVIIFTFTFCAKQSDKKAPSNVNQLILCGWDEVFILDISNQNEPPKKLWSWKAKERPELPEHMKNKFNSTDECKPVYGLTKVLITSSGGGVALVDRKTGRVPFYATVTNAHSADILPRDRVAVAASTSPTGTGDRIILFDLNISEKELYSDELPSGHGIVWDEERQILWALSGIDIRAYTLENWDSDLPSLSRINVIKLPESGGHDLSPFPGTPMLSVTTSNHCWLFNRDKLEFIPHPDIPDKVRIKSINVNPVTGQTAYVQAEGEHWWAERVHLINPERTLLLPGEHIYKARWNILAEK